MDPAGNKFRAGSHPRELPSSSAVDIQDGVCVEETQELLVGLCSTQLGTPRNAGKHMDFFQGSGDAALQIVGSELVIYVKYEIFCCYY